jgi:uroporphyrinogen-III synthase
VTILVTRPEPDNAATADALRRRGYEVLLAPVLQFEALPFRHDDDVRYGGVIATSSNALRAIRSHPLSGQLIDLPVYVVGGRTAEAARNAGFAKVMSADGDVTALHKLIVKAIPKRDRKVPLLYLSGSDIAGDIVTSLAGDGIMVTPLIVYRMIPVADLSDDVRSAFAAQTIDAVLHYSARSAAAFVAAVRGAAQEIAALALPQVCLSEAVARVLREAGATRLVVAEKPQEIAVLDALERALPLTQNRRG